MYLEKSYKHIILLRSDVREFVLFCNIQLKLYKCLFVVQ